jgi:uncharacterized protein (TIGR02246 family)
MSEDQQAIFDLVVTWMAATRAGDLATVLDLMSEDVVFLRSGQPEMRGREAFAAGFKAGAERFHIDARSDIQEIEVVGDLAYCWNQLSVTMTSLDGGAPSSRSGPVLSVLRREADGRWRICRDANLIS